MATVGKNTTERDRKSYFESVFKCKGMEVDLELFSALSLNLQSACYQNSVQILESVGRCSASIVVKRSF